MKKIFVLGIILLLVLTCSLPVFAAEDSVPVVPGGAYMEGADYGDDENAVTPDLTDDERQLRIDAYNEIFALSQTDKNIIAVKLSEDSRWLFLSIAGEPEMEKEYAMQFDQYAEFLIFTDDVDKTYENYLEGDDPEAGGLDIGGIGANKPDNSYYLWIAAIFGVLLLGSAFIFIKRKGLVPALLTANGKVITQNTSISKKETITAVKKSETVPEDKVFVSILQRIDKNNE